MLYSFRFYNHKKVMIVANSLDVALSVLSPDQRKDVKSHSSRKVTIRLD